MESKPKTGFGVHLNSSILVALLTAVCGWGISVEIRMNSVKTTEQLTDRITRMEDALMPLLVAYKVDEEIKKLQPPSFPKIDIPDAVKDNAHKWANERINNTKK